MGYSFAADIIGQSRENIIYLIPARIITVI